VRRENATVAGPVEDGEVPAHRLDGAFRDRQAEAGAAAIAFTSLDVGLEQLLRTFVLQSAAMIFD